MLELHRFFIAVSPVTVNLDGAGNAPDPLLGQLVDSPRGVGQFERGRLRPISRLNFWHKGWAPKGGGQTWKKVGALKGGPRRGGGARRVGPQHFALFSPLPALHSFLPLLGVFCGMLVLFEAGTLKSARLEFSGCRVKPRWPQSRWAREHHKTPREDPHRGRKKRFKTLAGEGKKRVKFRAVQPRGPKSTALELTDTLRESTSRPNKP